MNFSNFKCSIVFLGIALFATNVTVFGQPPKVFLGTWENQTIRHLVNMKQGIGHSIVGKQFLNRELSPLNNIYGAVFSDASDEVNVFAILNLEYNTKTHVLAGILAINKYAASKVLGPLKVNPGQTVYVNGVLSGPKLEDTQVSFEIK